MCFCPIIFKVLHCNFDVALVQVRGTSEEAGPSRARERADGGSGALSSDDDNFGSCVPPGEGDNTGGGGSLTSGVDDNPILTLQMLGEDVLPDVVLEVDIFHSGKEDEEEGSEMCATQCDEENTEEKSAESDGKEETEEEEDEKVNLCPPLHNYSIQTLQKVKGAIHYYTGLKDIVHFNYVFSCLGPAAFHLQYKSQKLSIQDEFLLLLMKLRQNKDDKELSMFFGVSPATVGKIFKTWLNFAYFQLKDLNIWNCRETVNTHMPQDFQAKFPSTRVIIDGTEIPVEKPKDPTDQSATWSSYKNRNTLKVLVGISPRGDVSHISEAYGGAASDRQIIERSDLLQRGKFAPNDSIMADRGFVVQDLFCMRQVQVNIPTVMRGMSQLPAETVVKDRRLASKRVHVERVIGLAKHFKIL